MGLLYIETIDHHAGLCQTNSLWKKWRAPKIGSIQQCSRSMLFHERASKFYGKSVKVIRTQQRSAYAATAANRHSDIRPGHYRRWKRIKAAGNVIHSDM